MIIIKKVYFLLIALLFFSCMEPNDEGLWSVEQISVLNTQGFCRSVSIKDNIAYVASGQAGVQVWDLVSGKVLHNYLGYSQDGSYIEFDDISIVKRDDVNNLLFVTESNKKVKVFYFDDSSNFVYRNEIMSDRTKDYVSFPTGGNRFTMYVADNDDGLKWGTYRSDTTTVFNIINWMPTAGGEISTDGKPLGIDSNGEDLVAMAVDQLGVEFYSLIYDQTIENAAGEPSFLSKFDLGGNAEQVNLVEKGAYISADDFGAYFIKKEVILSGEGLAIHFAEDLTVDHISVEDDIAILSIGSKGVALYDVSDIENPKAKGIFDVGYTYKTEFWNGHILICTRSGLKIAKINI
jgi:hypothetical protein